MEKWREESSQESLESCNNELLSRQCVYADLSWYCYVSNHKSIVDCINLQKFMKVVFSFTVVLIVL